MTYDPDDPIAKMLDDLDRRTEPLRKEYERKLKESTDRRIEAEVRYRVQVWKNRFFGGTYDDDDDESRHEDAVTRH